MTLFDRILQAAISGITSGSIYAILAISLSVVHNVTRIIDISQGQYVMLGGMLVCVFHMAGFPLLLCIALAVIIPVLVGLLIWGAVLYRPSQTFPLLALIMVTFGLASFIEGLSFVTFGTEQRSISYFFKIDPIHISGATVSPQAPIIFGVLVLMVIGLSLMFGRTILGKGLRACHDQPLGARLVGINPRSMMYFSYGLAISLGAIGGAVMAPLTSVSYNMAGNLFIKGFLAALVGGIYSFPGVIAGALALGLLEALSASFFSSAYASITALTVFLILLIIRPNGLFGSKEIRT